MIRKRLPTNTILNGIILDILKKEFVFDSTIKDYIKELKRLKLISLNQEEELKRFFLIQELKNEASIPFSKEDYYFFIRKLFSSYEIPNTEKIKLIYQGIKFDKIETEEAKDLLKDFNLVSYHNELIIQFEKTLK